MMGNNILTNVAHFHKSDDHFQISEKENNINEHMGLGRRFFNIIMPSKAKGNQPYSAMHFSFMTFALKPRTANTTNVARIEVKKLMKDTRTASKWQLLSLLL